MDFVEPFKVAELKMPRQKDAAPPEFSWQCPFRRKILTTATMMFWTPSYLQAGS